MKEKEVVEEKCNNFGTERRSRRNGTEYSWLRGSDYLDIKKKIMTKIPIF